MNRFNGWVSALTLAIAAGAAKGQTTTRVSVDSAGVQTTNDSGGASISPDGRYVAFNSAASNLVPGDTNGVVDAFVHDRATALTSRVSVTPAGIQGDARSYASWISADGRYIVMGSAATNLVPGDTNAYEDIVLRDCLTGTNTRLSVDSAEGQSNGDSGAGNASAGAAEVVFWSAASNLVPGDTNGTYDIFVRDCQAGTTSRVNVGSAGEQANGSSYHPRISDDGRFVAFHSLASNLVTNDTNGFLDVFVHDRWTGVTMKVSVDFMGAEANGNSYSPSVSGDGASVVFLSAASNLISGDTNGVVDVFVRDLLGGTTVRASVTSTGIQSDGDSDNPSISADGRFVVFHSAANNLVANDTNGFLDVFSYDRSAATISRVSLEFGGAEGNSRSYHAAVSSDGRYVGFQSDASNLVLGDTNARTDVFVRDRGPAFLITSFCFGDGTVVSCPCGNTGQPGRGCDNSLSTGGALLAGSGDALLSADTLLLTASNERPTAFSLFWQGGSEIAPRVFGDGVGCMGSPLKRMYGHNAVGGTVSVPQGADLSVSARSAALGNPIAPGTIRIHHVFYRDPDPNFCPPPFGSTFNTTNGLRVLWGS